MLSVSLCLLGPLLAPVPAGEVMSEFVICLCVSLRGKDFALKQSAFTLQPDTNTPRLPEESAHARKTLPATPPFSTNVALLCMQMCEKTHTPSLAPPNTHTHTHRE